MTTLDDLRALPPTLDTGQAAELLGISRWGLYDLARAGTAPVAPLHLGRKLRWPTAAILRAVGIDPAAVLTPDASGGAVPTTAPPHPAPTAPRLRSAGGG